MVKIVPSRPVRVANSKELETLVSREKCWSIFYIFGIICFFLASLSLSGVAPYLSKWRWHLYLASGVVLSIVNVQHLLSFTRKSKNPWFTSLTQEHETDYTGRMTEMFCTFILTMGSLMLANSALISLTLPKEAQEKNISWQFLLSYVAFLLGAAANGISSRSSSSEVLETRNAIIFQFIVASSSGVVARVIDIPGLVCEQKSTLKNGAVSWLQGISGALMLLGACLNYFHTEAYFEYEKLRLEEIFYKQEQAEQLDKEQEYNRKHGRLWVVKKFFNTFRDMRSPQTPGLPLLPVENSKNTKEQESSSYVTLCSESDVSQNESCSANSLMSSDLDSRSEMFVEEDEETSKRKPGRSHSLG